MKVLVVWDSEYPWDIRIEKMCDALLQAKWEVHLVCRNRSGRQLEEICEGIQIHRLYALQKQSPLCSLLNSVLTFPVFFSPLWLARIFSVAAHYKIDIIVVRDLPLALAAILVGKLTNIPVVLDLAESYPELIRAVWKFEPFKFSNLLVRNPFLADLVEYLALRSCEHIFVVVDESRHRLLLKGIDPSKITVVSNTPNLYRFPQTSGSFPSCLQGHRGKLILLYVGLLNHPRGLDTVIYALDIFLKHNRQVVLILLGTGTAESYLRSLVEQRRLHEHVSFQGWIDNTLLPTYIASADVGLVPHRKNSHSEHTIPNKLFDYMAGGKPVLVSNVGPMTRIVQQTNCGLIFQHDDPRKLCTQLLRLQDATLRKQLGRNGRKAVEEQYNWENDAARMLTVLTKVVESRSACSSATLP